MRCLENRRALLPVGNLRRSEGVGSEAGTRFPVYGSIRGSPLLTSASRKKTRPYGAMSTAPDGEPAFRQQMHLGARCSQFRSHWFSTRRPATRATTDFTGCLLPYHRAVTSDGNRSLGAFAGN